MSDHFCLVALTSLFRLTTNIVISIFSFPATIYGGRTRRKKCFEAAWARQVATDSRIPAKAYQPMTHDLSLKNFFNLLVIASFEVWCPLPESYRVKARKKWILYAGHVLISDDVRSRFSDPCGTCRSGMTGRFEQSLFCVNSRCTPQWSGSPIHTWWKLKDSCNVMAVRILLYHPGHRK